jgi:CheY-like chemotaxis protein
MIISNLLSNAIKFTNPGGKITVRVSFAFDTMKLEVADTGRGIHPDDLPHIFDRFFQSQLSDRSVEGGTGIGLSLTRELVETMGYSLNVQSVYERGSVFTLLAPGIFITEQATAEVQTSSLPLSGNNDLVQPEMVKPELMIAEDNVFFLAFMRELLSDNFSITLVNNGAQVMTHLHQGLVPDMIICDVMMPVMDGFQLMRALSNDDRYRKIPVVMLTARADEQDEIRLRQLGAVAYLVKPVEEQVLRQVIKEKLNQSAAQDPVEQIVQDNRSAGGEDLMDKLKNEIMARIADKELSVDQLAGIMLMSRSKFFVEVKKRTGKTPNQLILDARLDKARRLLEDDSRYTIRQILEEIGLSDKSNFINSFKKRFGHNPSWYMK